MVYGYQESRRLTAERDHAVRRATLAALSQQRADSLYRGSTAALQVAERKLVDLERVHAVSTRRLRVLQGIVQQSPPVHGQPDTVSASRLAECLEVAEALRDEVSLSQEIVGAQRRSYDTLATAYRTLRAGMDSLRVSHAALLGGGTRRRTLAVEPALFAGLCLGGTPCAGLGVAITIKRKR